MGKRRVLLLCMQSLMSEGLEAILRRLEDVDVIGPWLMDGETLTRLSQASMDVVLVVAEGEHLDPLTAQILERYPELPIIRVGLIQNVVHLYHSRVLPARSADLIEIIHSLPIR